MKINKMEYVGVHVVDLPHSVRGFTVVSGASSYDIFINARLSAEAQKQTYEHELIHINRNDYDMMYSVSELELASANLKNKKEVKY